MFGGTEWSEKWANSCSCKHAPQITLLVRGAPFGRHALVSAVHLLTYKILPNMHLIGVLEECLPYLSPIEGNSLIVSDMLSSERGQCTCTSSRSIATLAQFVSSDKRGENRISAIGSGDVGGLSLRSHARIFSTIRSQRKVRSMYEPVSFSLPLEIARGLDLDRAENAADDFEDDEALHPAADEYLQPELREPAFVVAEDLLGGVGSNDETFG